MPGKWWNQKIGVNDGNKFSMHDWESENQFDEKKWVFPRELKRMTLLPYRQHMGEKKVICVEFKRTEWW